MNCFDCAALADHVDAVAICADCGDCGAAVCHDHAHVTPRRLTRTAVINRTVAVEPPAPDHPLRRLPGRPRRRAGHRLRGGQLSKDTGGARPHTRPAAPPDRPR